MTSVSDDVSPGAQAAPSTLHAEPMYAQLMQAIGLAAVRLTPDGVVDFCNPVAERLFGWADGTGRGRSFADQVTESPEAMPAEPFAVAFGEGRAWAGRLVTSRRDPELGSAPATAVPIHDSEGAATGAVVLSLEHDSAVWPLLTGTLDGLLVVHRTGRVIYANSHAIHLLGARMLELQGLRVSSSAQPEAHGLGSLLVQRMSDHDRDAPFEFTVVRPSSPDLCIEATIAGTIPDGPLAGVRWRLRDVTHRRRLDERLEARAAELQSALESRVVIEQAKGFLAGRDGDSPDSAFERLRQYARANNLALREVARQLISREITLTQST